MKRLRPPGSRSTTGYKCMFDPDSGSIVNTPARITKAINDHWSKTFERQFTPDRRKLSHWLRDFAPKFRDTGLDDWIPSTREVERAIEEAHESAAGPDGLPFMAFKQCKALAARVLQGVIVAMTKDPAFDPGAHFNRAWLALLPKKAPHGRPSMGGRLQPPEPEAPLDCRVLQPHHRQRNALQACGQTRRGHWPRSTGLHARTANGGERAGG